VKVTREKTENSQAFLTIEMELAEVEESLEKSYRRLVKKANIPGFRKGKAPRPVLERHIGKESLFEDTLNSLLPQAYEKAISEQEIEAVAQPHIEITQTDPLIFKAVVPLPPTIKLGDYHSIQLTPEPVELSKKDIDLAMQQLRHQSATWEPVERVVEPADLVTLDVESSIDNEPFVNQEGFQYQVRSGSPLPAPGFSEQLIGMSRDEVKEFNLQFPSDYFKTELAGKEAVFEVKVAEVKQERLPELNDEFAQQISSDFKDLASLRERVATSLRSSAEERARMDFEQKVAEAVVDLAEVEFPPVLVEVEIDQLIRDRLQQWQMSGNAGLEDYLKTINKTGEELREELRPIATKRVTQSLVLGKVADEEKIEAGDAEIDAEIENMVKGTPENKDEMSKFLNTPQARQSVKQLLISRNTVQRLVDIAKDSGKSVDSKKRRRKK
jgi:trigger factor